MDISAIFMASGYSRRFQGNKLLEPLGRCPLYQYGFKQLQKGLQMASPRLTSTIVVVTAYDEIKEWCAAQGAMVCSNNQAAEGISASIRIGVNAIKRDAYAFFVADRPLLTARTIADFLVGFAASGHSLGAVACNGTPMNPAISNISIGKNYCPLRAMPGQENCCRPIGRNVGKRSDAVGTARRRYARRCRPSPSLSRRS